MADAHLLHVQRELDVPEPERGLSRVGILVSVT